MSELDKIVDNNKIRMIFVLYEFGSMKKTDLYAQVKSGNLNARKLDELEQVGVVTMTTDRFQNNLTIVELTDLGRAIARKLTDINLIMSGEIVTSDAETDYDPPSEQGDSLSR